MKKLMLLAAMLAMAVMAMSPATAMAEHINGFDDDEFVFFVPVEVEIDDIECGFVDEDLDGFVDEDDLDGFDDDFDGLVDEDDFVCVVTFDFDFDFDGEEDDDDDDDGFDFDGDGFDFDGFDFD